MRCGIGFWTALAVSACCGTAGAQPSASQELPQPQIASEKEVDEQDSPPEPPPRPALSLSRIEEFAARSHPSLRAARSDIEVAYGRAAQAGLYPNPVLRAGAEQFGGNQNELPFVFSQRIVTGGKLGLDQQASLQQAVQAEQRFARARYDVLTGVRRAYYRALAGRRRIETLRRLTDLLGKSRDVAQDRLKGGEATRTDVVLLEVELRQARANLRNAEAAQPGLLRGLLASAGAPDEPEIPAVTGDFELDFALDGYGELLAGVMASNSLIREADLEVTRRQILLRRAEAEPIPDVTVNLGYQHNTGPMNVNNKGVLNVSLPLPLWNRNEGNRYAASNAIHRAASEARTVRVRLGGSLADAWRRYQAATEQAQVLLREVVPSTREAVELTREGYQAGQLDLLRLLSAQQSFVRAYLSFIDTQEQRWLAAADIAGLLQADVFPPVTPGEAKPNPDAPADRILPESPARPAP